MTPEDDSAEDGGGDLMAIARRDRRLSRASVTFFQDETSIRNFSISSTSDGGLVDSEGRVRDEYILQRQSVNRPTKLNKVPLLCDLTTSSNITNVDGWVLSMLLVSGFAKMSSKINELNAINVFPIADGDTGANMKVCLKLPIRNLLLKPSDNIIIASREMAADVLLNGQGNSGTILSHFFVELAEAVREVKKSDMSVDEFASCLIKAGMAMDDAVPNPVNGTLLSVCRDALVGLKKQRPYATLDVLLSAMHRNCQSELAKTPDQLIVDGVKVLEKAGVVDSGAQGFAYLAEGMYLASIGELPNAFNPEMFHTVTLATVDDSPPISVDHTVCDSKCRYCTEAVMLLKEGVTPDVVFDRVQKAATQEGIGDSAVFVKGFDMVKIHMHTNNPDQLFDTLQPFNRDSILKKEKVEDMLAMRESMHGDETLDLGDAKFTIMGLCSYLLPRTFDLDELHTLPIFAVPSSTQEPIDMRFVSDEDVCVILNQQRHKESAVRYTTAASNPMQLKIEILAALTKGKPLLMFLFSTDKRVSAIGRNTMIAIDMLEDEQKKLVKVFVHGWTFYEQPFLMEAIKFAKAGKSIDEAIEACKEIADHCFSFSSFVTSSSVRKLQAWRPGLFPEGFTIEDDSFIAFGLPVTTRDVVLTDTERLGKLMGIQNKATSMVDLQDAEIARVKDNLKPDEKLSKIIVQTIGRIDIGHQYLQKLKDAHVPLMDDVELSVCNAGMFAAVASAWGEMSAVYVVKKV
mmetsp:Transcript_24951/g.40423  ORF Transcript_24951/g.40423 Transcript_24951/m.40423 type:complete len:743 (-) Transcript_24951:262-2490(-)